MNTRFRPEGGLETCGDIYDSQRGSDRVRIVSVHKLVERIQISLAVPSSLAVFGHDGLCFNCYPDRRRRRLSDSGVGRHRHDSRGRAENQVDVPLAAANNYLAIDVIDDLALAGVLGDPRTGVKKILQDDRTKELPVLV